MFASRSTSDTMCDEKHHGAVAVRRDLDDLLEKLPACDGIEARDGLVENQDVGPVAEPEQDRELLALTDRHVLDALLEGRPPTRGSSA